MDLFPIWGRTCDAAASGGHLEVLQWLRAQGCPWPMGLRGGAVRRAAFKNHPVVFKWAREQGEEMPRGSDALPIPN